MRAFWKRHRIEVVFALLVFAVHGYFYSGQGGNQNARLDGIYAVVENGRFEIDPFVEPPGGKSNTVDWSKANGHFYPNKAPGTVLVGIPYYALLSYVETWMGLDPTAFELAHWNAYLINLWLSVGFGALAAGMFVGWLLRQCPDQPAAALSISAVCFFGTLVFPFDSQIWGTTTAAYFIVFAWVFCQSARWGPARHFAVGTSLGMAVLFDYAAIVPVGFFCIYYALDANTKPHLPRLLMGALPIAMVLLGYHKWVFGSFFTHAAANTNEIFRTPGSGGEFFGPVRPDILWKLLFSKYRGLFYFMPVLGFIVPGAIFLYRAGHRIETLVCIAGIVASLLFISSFNGWFGGSATGPRYLISSLPYCFLLLGGLRFANAAWKKAFYAVGGLCAFQMFAIAAVGTAMSAHVRDPLRRVYRRFFDARFGMFDAPVRNFSELTHEQWAMTKFNLGQMIGLREFASLVPVVVLAILLSLWLRSLIGRKAEEAAHTEADTEKTD